MKKYSSLPLFCFLMIFFILGCAGISAAPTPDKLSTVVAATLKAVTAPTLSPALVTNEVATATPEPTIDSTMQETGVRYVYTNAYNVNLRVNPGKLFKVSRVMPQGTRLQVLGMAPGGQWLNVANDENIIGWVGADFVTGGYDGAPTPLSNPMDVQLISGTVLDVNGKPVSGIGFALTQRNQRDDGVTDKSGTFYIYLPLKAAGTWEISFVSIDCKSSVMEASCKCAGGTCGKPDPEIVSFTLPIPAPLNFVWK